MITNNMLTARWYKIESKQLINNFIALDAPEYLNLINSFFPSIKHNADLDTTVPNLEFLSWDIETFKKPLLFPDASKDPIMSIAYKCYKGLFLLVNREFYSENIDNFYFEKNEYCRVYNFNDEKSMLAFFLEHVRIYCKPHIIISYNGDVFDFPYLDQRCSVNGLSLCAQWGFTEHKPYSEKPLVEKSLIHYLSPFVIHIDCLKWVKRDSYLPQGSRGLKAVSRIKLNYECCEVAPELMVEYCRTKPQTMAEYNASDAVVTFALYEKYIHNFILALASIIPLNIDNILRKGAGSLCETLLMKMAVNSNVVIPCKTNDADDSWYDDEYYLINETYVGGSVEQMRTGVFKHDIKETFTIDPKVIDKLIDELDLTFMTFLQEEINPSNNIVSTNWDSIKVEITEKLNLLKSLRQFDMEPLIYHFDVGAMYPNIILTNRLQPYAIIDDQKCSKCVYSDEQQYCKKKMNWIRKSSMINLERHIVEQVEQSLKSQLFEDETKLTKNDTNTVPYYSLPVRKRKEIKVQKLKFLSAQLNKNKSQKKYEELLEANVCQRSNDFYIETVRAFRDRRMIYKKLKKESEKKLKTCDLEKQKKYENLVILYESLQLAHKCVLNSFYGYVMKRSARWHSIEMAALVTYVGGNIIKTAKNICMGVGLPLELDTDGIWTLLPKIFPTDYNISDVELKEEKLKFSYVCSMFNSETAKYFTNHNYHYFDKTKFVRTKVNSIFFEIDGPYQAMFLPASEKADKQLKKRYVVYDFKNKIVELKGFELKRRGELEMLKIFQKSIFPLYISGSCKEEIFSNLAKVAENWIRFIVSKGRNSTYKKIVLDLLTESVTVSKPVSESTRLKTFAVSTITKLSELRDDPSYLNEKGIKASFVLVSFPIHAPRMDLYLLKMMKNVNGEM
ncbi:DNA polymerase epsilon catalytic subunit 1 [Dermatophagoides farinae]|uniref:DNA polymerase epsilon catalytic subunit 1 n=1 Tax=Dermatophagoides farinae TaxID=6954 RepID=UPI003F601D09